MNDMVSARILVIIHFSKKYFLSSQKQKLLVRPLINGRKRSLMVLTIFCLGVNINKVGSESSRRYVDSRFVVSVIDDQ